ncbi:MAG: Hsp20/alpha crystallin family protein [Pyrinomonadaceae bacterium]
MVKVVHAVGLERLELERLRDEVGRLYASLLEATEADAAPPPGEWAPSVDLCESETAVTVRVEVPGVRAENLKVGLTSEQLRVYGEKKRRVPRGGGIQHLCSERAFGKFNRVVPLRRWTLSVRDASAELSNGVLIVHLPKARDRRGAEFKVAVREIRNTEDVKTEPE